MAYNFFDKLKNNIFRTGRILKTLPSRFIFGNLQSLSNNIKPIINKDIKLDSRNEIIERGFKKNNIKCDDQTIKKIQSKYNLCIGNREKSISTPNKKKKMIIDPIKNIPEIKLLLPFIESELKDYYKNGFIIDQVKAWRNFSDDMYFEKKQNYIYSNIWHIDQFQVDKLNVFILLNDNVNKETGATRILDISTSKKFIRSFKFIDTSISTKTMNEIISKNNKINYLEGDLGDIWIFNATKCLHAASIPKPGSTRDIIQFEIYPYKLNSKFKRNDFSYKEDVYIKSLMN